MKCFACQRTRETAHAIPESKNDQSDMDICEECLDMLRSHLRQIAMASYRAQIETVNHMGSRMKGEKSCDLSRR